MPDTQRLERIELVYKSGHAPQCDKEWEQRGLDVLVWQQGTVARRGTWRQRKTGRLPKLSVEI